MARIKRTPQEKKRLRQERLLREQREKARITGQPVSQIEETIPVQIEPIRQTKETITPTPPTGAGITPTPTESTPTLPEPTPGIQTPQKRTQELLKEFKAGEEAERLAGLSVPEQFEEMIAEQERQKTVEKEITEFERKMREAQLEEFKKRSERAMRGVETQLAQGPEGVITTTAPLLSGEFRATQQRRIQFAVDQARVADLRVKELERQAERERQAGRVEAAATIIEQADLARERAEQSRRQAALISQQIQESAQTLIASDNAGLKGLLTDDFLLAATSDQITDIITQFPNATIPSSFFVARATIAKEKAEADKADDQIKSRKLQLELDKLEREAQRPQFEFQARLSTLGALANQGIINQDQLNTAVEQIFGIEPPQPTFQLGRVGNKSVIFDPTTGATTVVNVGTPTISSVGNGKITQNYGDTTPATKDNVKLQNGKVGTPGLDIDGRTGDPIRTFTGGTVTSIANRGGYGNQVIITDAQGNQHMYSHFRDLNVPVIVGQQINAGDVIGYMGNTGTVFPKPAAGDIETGSHLDYRVKSPNAVNGSHWGDPNLFISNIETTSEKQALLTQLATGRLTNTRVSEIQQQAQNEGWLNEFTRVVDNPKITFINEGTANKFKLPLGISQLQADDIIQRRQDAGLGNRLFQSLGVKPEDGAKTEWKKITDWLKLLKDLEEMRELKKNVNTGPIAGATLGSREFFGRASADEIRLDVLSKKYTVKFMKEISGVAIAEQEAKRLQKLIPNVNLEDIRFIEALDITERGTQRNLNDAARKFGFRDFNDMSKALDRIEIEEFAPRSNAELLGIASSPSDISNDPLNFGKPSNPLDLDL